MSRRADIPVGLMLAPDEVFLDLLHEAIHHDVDYAEVTPETLWIEEDDRSLRANGFHREFLALKDKRDLAFVAHSVGYDLGSVYHGDEQLRARWLQRMREDQMRFGFRWLTSHLGAMSLAGQALALPLALPMTPASAAGVRSRLREMQQVVPAVCIENSAFYYLCGALLDEPAFLRSILRDPDFHLLLDLHNLHTMAENFDIDPRDYLRRLPLERVVEIHIAGGGPSDPRWLPEDSPMHLDSHDQAVPEPVWTLLEEVVPRCPNLRGVTLERMEGTVTAQDVAPIRGELARAKRLVQPAGSPAVVAVPTRFAEPIPSKTLSEPTQSEADQLRLFETLVASALMSEDPARAFADAATNEHLSEPLQRAAAQVRPDGARLSALLILKLRFERLVQSSAQAAHNFEDDPREFSRAFKRYHAEIPPGPREADDFAAWNQREQRTDAAPRSLHSSVEASPLRSPRQVGSRTT